MKIIEPGFEILFPTPEIAKEWFLRLIEIAGRTCYKSEHEAMIEIGVDPVVRIVCDRGVSHEIVLHRLASYGQDKHGGELCFIRPVFWTDKELLGSASWKMWNLWYSAMVEAEDTYLDMIEMGAKPEEARDVLPISLKTEIVMKANVREWCHFFKLCTAKAAHPQMRQIARPMLARFRKLIPVVFDDVGVV